MPERKTIERAQRDKRQGKSPSTQAGEFVREEIHHVREGKHGARSTKQAIAIGLSKARRAGVDLPPPKKGQTSEKTRKSVQRAYARGYGAPAKRKPSAKRSRAVQAALDREGTRAASHEATTVVLSTPDRDRRRGPDDMGPPGNWSHVREWNVEEFRAYLESRGFRVDESRIVDLREGMPTCHLVVGAFERRA